MVRTKLEKPRGVLNFRAHGERSHFARYYPSPDLEFFVEHYWIVRWDLRGQEPHLQETLPHPSIHVVFERRNSRIVGILRGRFPVVLKDKGGVFGIKFLPGAFYPFLKSPVSGLTDKVTSIGEIFDVDTEAIEEAIFSHEEDDKMIELAEGFLRERLPERDEKCSRGPPYCRIHNG